MIKVVRGKYISFIKVENTLINNYSPQKSRAILNPLSHVTITFGNVATLLRQFFFFYVKYFIVEAPVWTRKLMSVVVVIDKVDNVEIAFAFFLTWL